MDLVRNTVLNFKMQGFVGALGGTNHEEFFSGKGIYAALVKANNNWARTAIGSGSCPFKTVCLWVSALHGFLIGFRIQVCAVSRIAGVDAVHLLHDMVCILLQFLNCFRFGQALVMEDRVADI